MDCTSHRIRADTVNELVLDTLRTISEYARENKADFVRKVNEMFSTQQAGTVKAQRKKLSASQKRCDELDKLIQRVYEDMVAERITGKRFDVLSAEYECECKREYHREYQRRRKENGGKPLTPEDNRTPEQIAADEAAKREKWKAYQRDYQREWQRKKAREKREAKAAETEVAAV